jgi:3'-phosphoadenosine 5'-phosphosulfate sulfotransferase (PAPS reductase)/FAD synthetase
MRTLPRKQASTHEDWLEVTAAIAADPTTPARAQALVGEAAERLARRLDAAAHPVFGWSGGKDSLALEVVCKAAGLDDCVLVISGLEYPAFLAWATDHMPWGLAIECQSNLNLGWLRANPKMLFPTDAQIAAKWFASVQHAGQRAFAKRTGMDVLVLGRRKADGNFCGKPTDLGYEYTDKGDFQRFSPIAEWSHEDTLTVLVANDITLPPCYSWPRGFRVGTGSWPARQWTTSPEHGWDEVTFIDHTVTENAARHQIPGAQQALQRLERGENTLCAV